MSQSIEAFVEIAKSYCELIEGHADYSNEEFLARVREILPLLYYQALGLVEPECTDVNLERDVTHEQWQELFENLEEKLGLRSIYWEIYDPITSGPGDPVAGSIADDLADIWRDLKNGLLNWDEDSAPIRQEIIWQWHFSFHNHWSSHLVDTLRVIDRLFEHDKFCDDIP